MINYRQINMFKDQGTLIQNILLYLQNQSKLATGEQGLATRKQELDDLANYYKNSAGECSGLSIIFSQKKFTSIQSQNTEKALEYLKNVEKAHDLLFNYNETLKLSSKDKTLIEQFISQIKHYSENSKATLQIDAKTLKSDLLGLPKEAFNYQLISTKQGFESTLKKVLAQKTDMVFLDAHKQLYPAGHRMAIFINENKTFSFYDPNLGEVICNDVTDLADEAWNGLELDAPGPKSGFFQKDLNQFFLRKFILEGFNFKDAQTNYPSMQEIQRESFKEQSYKAPINFALNNFSGQRNIADFEMIEYLKSLPIFYFYQKDEDSSKNPNPLNIIKLLKKIGRLEEVLGCGYFFRNYFLDLIQAAARANSR